MTTRFFTFLTVWVLSLTHSFSADIDVNKQYYIFHASGCVIGGSKSIPVLEDFQSDSNQKFKFVKTGNYYTIRNNEYATNIAKTGSWNTEYNSTTANVAQFSIEDGGGEFIKLKCRDNNLYLGTDNTTVGSNIYSDKNGNELLHYWYLREASDAVLILDGLESAINEAESLLQRTKEGTNEGEYSQTTRADLQNAIDDAKDSKRTSRKQSDINSATQEMRAAMTAYRDHRNSAFIIGEKYYIVHASNRYLTNNNGTAQIKEYEGNSSQQFLFERINNGDFAIKNISTNQYLNASGEYKTNFTSSPDEKTSQFKIEYAPNENYYIRIQFSSNDKYMGTDATSDGGGVYSDKSGTDGKHYWHLVRVDTPKNAHRGSFINGSSATRLGVNWEDEAGLHINAHGGCVLYENGTYYWFGENYRTSGAVKSNGIVCYSSTDLYNWKKVGMAYECPSAPLRSDYQDMNYGRTLERPKVIYNPDTKQYAMWVHWENGSGYAASRVAILYSDKITGPYTFLKTMRPRGDEQPSGSRDQTLLFDPDYNTAYHFGSAEENMTMHATLLTDNFLDLSNTWERIFIKKQYEAPAVFKYHGRFMAITSGCTGWNPNPAHSSVSELPLGGWIDLGNPCVDKDFNTSYNTQSNYILKVPSKYDAYIYMSDRWKGGDYFSDANVGESWHIWLPIDMRTGYPIIHFYEEWDLSIFDKINRYRRVADYELGKEYLLLSRNSNRILSEKDGRFTLSSDDDEINLPFTIMRSENGSIFLKNTNDNRFLCHEAGNICWADSSSSANIRWQCEKAGNDGYYFIHPADDKSLVLTNLCATYTNDGVVGLQKSSDNIACKFAFCFDSEKRNYAPIADESDGSYKNWMENTLHRTPINTTNTPDFKSAKSKKNLTFSIEGETLHILTNKMQEIFIYDITGRLLHNIQANANESLSIRLNKGIYLVNGEKIIVE